MIFSVGWFLCSIYFLKKGSKAGRKAYRSADLCVTMRFCHGFFCFVPKVLGGWQYGSRNAKRRQSGTD
jgi:hypothetical protein